jgi:hypothetical protein
MRVAGGMRPSPAACRAESCRAEPASEGGLPSRSLPGGASKRRRLAEPKLAGRSQQAKGWWPGLVRVRTRALSVQLRRYGGQRSGGLSIVAHADVGKRERRLVDLNSTSWTD